MMRCYDDPADRLDLNREKKKIGPTSFRQNKIHPNDMRRTRFGSRKCILEHNPLNFFLFNIYLLILIVNRPTKFINGLPSVEGPKELNHILMWDKYWNIKDTYKRTIDENLG